MITFKRGDIVLCWFPHRDVTNLSRRPALVVQTDNLATGIPQIVLALITTNLSRLGHPSRVFIPAIAPNGTPTGLTADSVVMTDNLGTIIIIKAVERVLGRIPDMRPDDDALRHTLGL